MRTTKSRRRANAMRLAFSDSKRARPVHFVELLTLDTGEDDAPGSEPGEHRAKLLADAAAELAAVDDPAAAIAEIVAAFLSAPPIGAEDPEPAPGAEIMKAGETVADAILARGDGAGSGYPPKAPETELERFQRRQAKRQQQREQAPRRGTIRFRDDDRAPAPAPAPGAAIDDTEAGPLPGANTPEGARQPEDVQAAVDVLAAAVRQSLELAEPMAAAVQALRDIGQAAAAETLERSIAAAGTEQPDPAEARADRTGAELLRAARVRQGLE